MQLKKIRNGAVIVALLAVCSFFSFSLGRKSVGLTKKEDLDLHLMWQVKDKLEEKFLDKDKMDKKNMAYGLIRGMVESLGDPYTVFLAPEENKVSDENLAGEFGGVGISLGYKDKTLAVMTPLPGTPAEKKGVKAGDLILKIIDEMNGVEKDTVGISLNEAVELIRGKIGSEVILKMYREGKDEPFDVVLTRANIVVPSIELEWKEKKGKKVAWIKLYKFTERLYEEWNQIVDEVLAEKNLGGVVLDLRNNPGGFLQASVMVASDFLKDGVVVEQESSDGSVEGYKVDKSKRRLLDTNLVVLINGGSASASEILAGALQDYGRAKLVGEKSFGKGTVQQPEEFADGSGLHVTIAKWLLPNGKNIHNEGVEADVKVENEVETEVDEQLEKAMEVVLE
ncbi:PDZ domain-containing protein [Patescibacteria group bacterium]|nr:PDZ domain-containing protein [Patescibacteria group bacterium]